MKQALLFPLPGSAAFTEQQFDDFARDRLRPLVSGRVEASVLRAAYLEWAAARSAPEISFRHLKALMRRHGYRHFYSNRAWYGGLVLVPDGSDCDEVPPPAGPQPQLFALDLLARIDAVTADIERSLGELTALRGRLVDAVR